MGQSFLTQLGKGFIRSAVNQVGRDGGKVISNNIYGNQHSTPIRIVSNSGIENTEMPDGVYTKQENTVFKVIGAIILSFVIPFVGGAILIYKGIVNYKKETAKLYKKELQATYVQDRRYKSGQRFEGNREIEVYVGEIEDDKYKKISTIKGIIYLIIGSLSILFFSVAILNK